MRVRKLFIFYDYKKQITCVGADDRQTMGSGLLYSTPVNSSLGYCYTINYNRMFVVEEKPHI